MEGRKELPVELFQSALATTRVLCFKLHCFSEPLFRF